MFVSAEVRWFWKDAAPAAVDSGSAAAPARPVEERRGPTNISSRHGQRELGVKQRGGTSGVEVKGLVELRGDLRPPSPGEFRFWCKWTSEALTIDHLPRVSLHKTRLIRKDDITGTAVTEVELDAAERPRHDPARRLERGCQLELVALRVGDRHEAWSSLGFEAFGELDTLEDSLHRIVAQLARNAPPLTLGTELSYPEWLDTLRV